MPKRHNVKRHRHAALLSEVACRTIKSCGFWLHGVSLRIFVISVLLIHMEFLKCTESTRPPFFFKLSAGMDEPGPSKPLKGILKKGTTPAPDPYMHETDCPMSASFSVTGLPHCCGSGVASALGQPLKSILRTNLRGSMSDSNPNGMKCRWV